jgi:proteasome alpha subunit
MTDEPYRWLEAMGNRREYVQEQLREGSPAFAVSLPDGILLLGVGSGQSKVFEIHDRHAMAALGHPADLERIRQSAIDAAHLEAFARAAEDVSLRRLVGFGLSALLKQNFEQLFTAPVLGEFVFAELGADPAGDSLMRLRFDGSFFIQGGRVAVVAARPDRESASIAWLTEALNGIDDRSSAARILLEGWWLLITGKSFTESVPPPGERESGWRAALAGKSLELGWLSRSRRRAARYDALDPASVLGSGADSPDLVLR